MLGEIKVKNGSKLFNNDFATTGIPLHLYSLSFFILWCSICAGLSFKLSKLLPWSYICLGGTICLFILPNKIIPYWDKIVSTRKWLFIRIVRLIFSGLYPVEFGDFFLGDIISSLTYSMSDIAMFGCMITTGEKGQCSSSHLKSMGIIACLPSAWRLLQCLRRYADSADAFPHLVNAIKYGLGMAYNVTLCIYRLSNHNPSKRTPFIVFAAFNAIATSTWDLVIDWSLFQPSKHNLFLRNDLYLAGPKNWKNGTYDSKRKAVYYVAMIWNVAIRFQWIVYAVAPSTIQQSATTSFVLAFLEVIRRFVWVIFRVENEHVANVHLFKVSSEAPLPYPIVYSPNMDMELSDSFDTSSRKSSITSENYLSTSHMEEPSSAYHSMIRRRASMFNDLARQISRAHVSDFERPTKVYSNVEGHNENSDSDSDRQ